MKNLKIGTQLRLGFASMLFFILVLGSVSYYQSVQIHKQTEIMYEHPLSVSRALGMLRGNIFAIQSDLKDIFLISDDKEIAFNQNQIEQWKINSFDQINIIYSKYLGPQSDIDTLKKEFIRWNELNNESIRLIQLKKNTETFYLKKHIETNDIQLIVLLAKLQKVNDFAIAKATSLSDNSTKLAISLKQQLILLILIILLFIFFINFSLLQNIRKPLDELTNVADRFQKGEVDVRSSYESKNEFGKLSDSINSLIENIHKNLSLNEKIVNLSGLMLSKFAPKEFFQETINALALHTGSQMAAIYMLSDDKKIFEHIESIGLGINARKSFAADTLEGEFGSAISSRKVQHIKNIEDDTRFVFYTVSGKFIPHEIINIPIVAENEVVAIISLSSVSKYSDRGYPTG